MENTNILIICTGNSCRSQIAEGYFKFFKNKMKLKINIFSAGIKAEGINPKAAEIMLKDHIDISGQTSNKIDEYSDIDITEADNNILISSKNLGDNKYHNALINRCFSPS